MVLKHISDLLGSLFRSHARPKEAGHSAAQLEQKVLALVDNMPTLPDTAARAMTLARDPDTTLNDFARLIEGDAAIATGLLRIANSALYASACPALKLSQAVLRLGMWNSKNLIAAIGMRSLFQRMAGDTKEQCEVLWHHGFVTACLCTQMNSAYRLGFDGEEFSAGMLHDLGRILLLLADPDCFARADGLNFRENADQLERKRAAIGIDHCALGGWFGEHSRLPTSLIDAMRLHHEPALADHSKRLVPLVATADHMANHLERGEDPQAYQPEDNPGLACLWARWPQGRKERFLVELPSMLEESLQVAAAEHAS